MSLLSKGSTMQHHLNSMVKLIMIWAQILINLITSLESIIPNHGAAFKFGI